MKYIAILLILLSASANADTSELKIQINGRSVHFCDACRFNEANTGLGLEVDWESRGLGDVNFVTAGGIINSLGYESWYVGTGKRWRFIDAGVKAEIGFLAGIVGYPTHTDMNYMTPVLLPVLHIGYRRVGVNVLYIPPINDKVTAALLFQLTIATPLP